MQKTYVWFDLSVPVGDRVEVVLLCGDGLPSLGPVT